MKLRIQSMKTLWKYWKTHFKTEINSIIARGKKDGVLFMAYFLIFFKIFKIFWKIYILLILMYSIKNWIQFLLQRKTPNFDLIFIPNLRFILRLVDAISKETIVIVSKGMTKETKLLTIIKITTNYIIALLVNCSLAFLDFYTLFIEKLIINFRYNKLKTPSVNLSDFLEKTIISIYFAFYDKYKDIIIRKKKIL